MRVFKDVLMLFAALASGIGATSIAHAEAITVEGVYAARADLPPDIELVLVDRFQGDLGQDLEFALTDVLGGVIIRGEPYFDLITPNVLQTAEVTVDGNDGTVTTRPLMPDAELRGSMHSEVIEREMEPRYERECIRRDEDEKCVDWREIEIECRELGSGRTKPTFEV
ncbi:hypothetical protein EH31_10115 [Erythrobacter longus]|uniref:Uncharacterized protein n=1 Tax=Erythrobacter longus TaxID=1044 RepID=A0A074MAJ7_ERYLO|nr:hypothetical protein [Erythrobacter longus]KEO90434.1 hypothetical protein EH31_10115 [Erythrobacter longus]